MKLTTIKKINGADTLKDYLNVLQEQFKTKECKPGRFIKATLIYSIMSKLGSANINPAALQKVKNESLESDNIFEFIEIIKNSFDTSIKLTDHAKQNLIKDTEKLLLTVPMEEQPDAIPDKVKKETPEPPAEDTGTPAKKKRR